MWTQTIPLFSDKARTFSPCALVQGKNTVIVFSPQYLQADIWETQRQTKYWHANNSLPDICLQGDIWYQYARLTKYLLDSKLGLFQQ